MDSYFTDYTEEELEKYSTNITQLRGNLQLDFENYYLKFGFDENYDKKIPNKIFLPIFELDDVKSQYLISNINKILPTFEERKQFYILLNRNENIVFKKDFSEVDQLNTYSEKLLNVNMYIYDFDENSITFNVDGFLNQYVNNKITRTSIVNGIKNVLGKNRIVVKDYKNNIIKQVNIIENYETPLVEKKKKILKDIFVYGLFFTVLLKINSYNKN